MKLFAPTALVLALASAFPAAAQSNEELLKELRALRELAGRNFVRGIVLHGGRDSTRFDPTLMSAPVSALWSA